MEPDGSMRLESDSKKVFRVVFEDGIGKVKHLASGSTTVIKPLSKLAR
jgi:hypothetical protein